MRYLIQRPSLGFSGGTQMEENTIRIKHIGIKAYKTDFLNIFVISGGMQLGPCDMCVNYQNGCLDHFAGPNMCAYTTCIMSLRFLGATSKVTSRRVGLPTYDSEHSRDCIVLPQWATMTDIPFCHIILTLS